MERLCMKKLMLFLIVTGMMFGTIAIGHAEDWQWRGSIRDRIRMDNQRIEQGIERGSLTRHEARRLQDELDSILDKIDRMKQDGYLDEREREVINRDLDRLDRDIRREKRDDDRREGRDGERRDQRGGDPNIIFELKL